MIVRILSRGKSFKGLATYLTHDPDAKTNDRVAWTHTFNLANDHVPSAVDEMLWTARNAELLKQEAGIRAGGRATENQVKHMSLNWSPEDHPTREHMIESAEDFLRHMKWQEHQAVLVAHNDKDYAHVHIMLNTIHPETGLRLDDNFERRRAQAWALEYEREHGRIYCEQRLLNPDERQDAPTRPAWRAFDEMKKEFERVEKARRDNEPVLDGAQNNPKVADFDAWKALKEMQKRERTDFFAEGKTAFSELRRTVNAEVREEFRERWADFYAAGNNGADAATQAEAKARLVAEQKTVLEERRDAACKELRESRDGAYRDLLADQREARAGLRGRQEVGFDNRHFLERAEENAAGKYWTPPFREAATEATGRSSNERGAGEEAFAGSQRHETSRMKSGPDIGASVATGLGFGFLSFFESIADGMVGSEQAPRPRQPEPETTRLNLFDHAAEEARQKAARDKELEEKRYYDEQWARSRD